MAVGALYRVLRVRPPPPWSAAGRNAAGSTVKSLDSFDFAAILSLNKTLVLELARSEYVGRRENIIAVGNSAPARLT
jgi:hypothetical protein